MAGKKVEKLDDEEWSTDLDNQDTSSFIKRRSRNGELRQGLYDNSGTAFNSPQESYDGDDKSQGRIDISSFFLDLELDGVASLPNVVSYSSQKPESHTHEDEYRSFKACLAGCNVGYRREFMTLLFPVFSNLILDLALKGMWTTAQSLLLKYGPDHEDQHREDVKRLTIAVKAQVVDDSICRLVRGIEQQSSLSKQVLAYLIQHLGRGNHSVLLEILNRHINLSSSMVSEQDVAFDAYTLMDDGQQEPDISEEETLLINRLDLVTEGMRRAKHKKTSVCFHSVTNAFQGLTSVTFSPSSQLICGGFEDSSIRIWSLTPKRFNIKPRSSQGTNVDSGVDYLCLRGHDGPVYSTNFLTDGSALLSASEDTSVRLWSLQHQACLCEYRGHNSPVWSVNSNHNGTYFASASQDRTVRLWSTEYVYPLRIFAGHNGSVDCVTFHHNSNYLASGSSDKTCRLWDLQSGQFVRVLVGQKGSTYCLAFSADGKYLVSGGDCSRIMIWDLGSGKLVEELNGRNDIIYSLSFSKNGSFLASAGVDGVIEIWNFKTGEPVLDDSQTSTSHCDFIDTYTVKSSTVLALQFVHANLLYAAGAADHR